MPSPLIGDLGILPCSKEETKALSESEEVEDDEVWDLDEDAVDEMRDLDEDAVDEMRDQGEDVAGNEVKASQVARDDHQNVGKEEVRLRQDVGEEMRYSSEEVRSKEALSPLSSIDLQVSSYYDPLLALCLLFQCSNALDILMSLEILSRLI